MPPPWYPVSVYSISIFRGSREDILQGIIVERQRTGREDENITPPPSLAYLSLTKLCFILASLLWSLCPNSIHQCSTLWSLHLMVSVINIQQSQHLSENSVLSASLAATAFSRFNLVFHRCLSPPEIRLELIPYTGWLLPLHQQIII